MKRFCPPCSVITSCSFNRYYRVRPVLKNLNASLSESDKILPKCWKLFNFFTVTFHFWNQLFNIDIIATLAFSGPQTDDLQKWKVMLPIMCLLWFGSFFGKCLNLPCSQSLEKRVVEFSNWGYKIRKIFA